jgi:hypothetical protein
MHALVTQTPANVITKKARVTRDVQPANADHSHAPAAPTTAKVRESISADNCVTATKKTQIKISAV